MTTGLFPTVIRRTPAMETRLAVFAEGLAEHGDEELAARALGLSAASGRRLLRMLRAELGWQAV